MMFWNAYAGDEFQLVTIRLWHGFILFFFELWMFVPRSARPSLREPAVLFSSKLVRPHKHIPIFCFTELVVPNNPNTII